MAITPVMMQMRMRSIAMSMGRNCIRVNARSSIIWTPPPGASMLEEGEEVLKPRATIASLIDPAVSKRALKKRASSPARVLSMRAKPSSRQRTPRVATPSAMSLAREKTTSMKRRAKRKVRTSSFDPRAADAPNPILHSSRTTFSHTHTHATIPSATLSK